MKILVVGAGATGGYFGARLAQAGRDVTFLVRPARAQQLTKTGLQIASPFGDFVIRPQLLLASEITTPFDVVMLTVKAYGLDQALDDIAPAVSASTMILPVLNGMQHMDALAKRFGAHTVLGCACKVATVVDDDGRIAQLNTMQELVYGEMDGTRTPRVEELDDAMQGAVFTARLSLTIEQEMWGKWVMLASLGGVTCLMRGSIGEIEAAPGGAEFALGFLTEVVATVSALGHPPDDAFVESLQARLTAKASPWTSSMFRDLQQGRPVEADQILGDLLARARGAGVVTPLLAAAHANLSVYQSGLNNRG